MLILPEVRLMAQRRALFFVAINHLIAQVFKLS